MALSKGVNSYVTVAEADTYFGDRLDVSAWIAADSTSKAQALVTATGVLDDQVWLGMAVDSAQPLAFPRSGYFFDTRVGINVAANPVPDRILKATFELAYHLLGNDGILDDTGNVLDLTVGTVVLTKIRSPNLIPANVKRTISPMLANGGSRNWWRAN